MAYRPPFCVNHDCPNHLDPNSRAGQALLRKAWFNRIGYHYTKVRGPVPRFQCRACGKTFSRQTFRLDYYVKRTVSYRRIRASVVTCRGVRATSRSLGISPDSVTNRVSRLARQYLSACFELSADHQLGEALVSDGFESFAVSQYFPNNIHLLAGKDSQFCYFADYVTLRRKGRMTPNQKDLRAGLEKLYRADPAALTASFTEVLDAVEGLCRNARASTVEFYTDEKPEYQRALKAHGALRARLLDGSFRHLTVSGKAMRTRLNPLFTVNYLDRELRKDLAEHVRETVRFARNVNHCMERLWLYLGYHNLHKRYRINDPVGVQRTHADEAGFTNEQQVYVLRKITTERRFLSFQELPEAAKRCWTRRYETPLKQAHPLVLKAVLKRGRTEDVQLDALVKSLDLDSAIRDRPQYVPLYAFH